MRISSHLPAHIANAYGIPRAQALHKPLAPIPIRSARPLASVSSVDRIHAELNVKRPASIDHLVGGSVNAPIRFDGAATALSGTGETLQLYTRAADRVEAAVDINLGRAIDVTG